MGNEIKMVNFKKIVKTVAVKGEEFVLFSFELSELTEQLKELGYQKKMYGTLNKKEIENGIIKEGHCLADFAHGNTIGKAIDHRIEMETIKGMTIDELIAYYKNK